MCVQKLATLVLLLAACCVGGVGEAFAQLQVEPDPERNSYRLRIVNATDEFLTIKIVGRRARGFSGDLPPGQAAGDVFWGGNRVVCAWNRSGELVVMASLYINQSGTVRVRPLFAPVTSEVPGAAPRAMQAFPTLEID